MSRSTDPTTQAGNQSQRRQQLAALELALRPSPQAPQQPQPWPTQAPSGLAQYAYPGGTAGQTAAACPGQSTAQPPSYHYPQRAPSEAGYGLAGAVAAAQPDTLGAQSAAPINGHSAYSTYGSQFDRHSPGQPQILHAHGGHEPGRAFEQPPFIPRAAPVHDPAFPPMPTGSTTRSLRPPLAGGTMDQPRSELRGAAYDQWPVSHDPGNYDLGSYMPPGAANQGGYQPQQQGAGHGPHAEPQWPHNDEFDIHEQDPAAAFANNRQSYAGNEPLLVAGQPQDHEDADYEVEEPRRGRSVAIVLALVAAIASGGGLAYAYKTFVNPPSKSVLPVLKADNRPAKTQPVDPGGKRFAHQESKLMGRLGAESGDTATPQPQDVASSDSDAPGIRKVSTIPVGRDGSIAALAAEAPPRLPPPMVEVPGMMIVDGFGGRGPVAMAQRRRPNELAPQPAGHVQAEPVTPSPAVMRPQVISKVNAAPLPAGLGGEVLPPPAPPAKKMPRPAPVAALASPSVAAGPAPAVKTGSAGYVAVLSSQRSRMDALKTFADLQQKYGSVLANKIPDVREADLSARALGTVYRVVVGPPGPREAANSICDRLKSAGFSGCWVTAH